MKKRYKLILIFVILTLVFTPSYSVKADPTNSIVDNLTPEIEDAKKSIDQSREDQKNMTDEEKNKKIEYDCKYIFGDPNVDGTFANMIQKILNYIKILAPLLVILLSGFDFTKNALTGDQDEMKKATKKLGIRLACAVGIYLAPLLTGFLINFINNSSVDQACNIK